MKISELPCPILAYYATRELAILAARPLDQDGTTFSLKLKNNRTDIWEYRLSNKTIRASWTRRQV